MKCSTAQKLINEHIDNPLEAGQARRLERHLDGCADCRGFLSEIKSIVNNAKELDSLNPSDDLWPAIKREVLKKNRGARIRQKRLFWNFPLYSRGPAVALVTLFGMMILIPLLYYGLPLMRVANSDPGKTALSNFRIAQQQYQSAIEALDRAIAAQDVELSPELLAVFKKNLAIIDDSIRICTESTDNHPETQETNKLLLICYRKKLELLNEIKAIIMRS